MTAEKAIFDKWPEKYDQWFMTPIGSLVRKYESELILSFLKPAPGEMILDAGCGTGVFTSDIIASGSQVIGLDISIPMLRRAREKPGSGRFLPIQGDISTLPFRAESFDKVVSVTALEFIDNAKSAVAELFRVAKKRRHRCCGHPQQPGPVGSAEKRGGEKRTLHIQQSRIEIPGRPALAFSFQRSGGNCHPLWQRIFA